MIKAGKKTKAWEKARAEVKQDFYSRGITECEIGFECCWRNNALSFAHTRKRRNVVALKRVVLACVPCHQVVERWPEDRMQEYLEDIISRRTK